ncbi:hypothetical protein Tco_0307989 [Tanacetum coccineum]
MLGLGKSFDKMGTMGRSAEQCRSLRKKEGDEFNNSEDEEVAETDFMEKSSQSMEHSVHVDKEISADPFGLNDLLGLKKPVEENLEPSPSLSHPPGNEDGEGVYLDVKFCEGGKLELCLVFSEAVATLLCRRGVRRNIYDFVGTLEGEAILMGGLITSGTNDERRVDFAKAYDSVRWASCLTSLRAFGVFEFNLVVLGLEVFDFAKASLLVNGSPVLTSFIFIVGLKSSVILGLMGGGWDDSSKLGMMIILKLQSVLSNGKAKTLALVCGFGVRVFEDDSLWFRVIQAVHGDKIDSHSVRKVSIWSSILKEVQVLKSSGFDFLSYCSKRIGDGHYIVLERDWIGDIPFVELCPRLYLALICSNIWFCGTKAPKDGWPWIRPLFGDQGRGRGFLNSKNLRFKFVFGYSVVLSTLMIVGISPF